MKFWLRLFALFSVFILPGCGSDSGFNEETDFIRKEGSVQFINLMPDSPELTVVHGLNQSAVRYAFTSGVEVRFQDRYDWRIAYIDTSGDEINVAREDDQQISEDTLSTFLLMGTLDQPDIQVVDIPVPALEDRPEDAASIWFASNISTASMVDIYITDFGSDLSSSTPLLSLDSGTYSESFSVSAGDSRQLRITVAGTSELLFDSGEIQIPGQSLDLFALADDFGPDGANHVDVVRTASVSNSRIKDVSQPAEVRVASFSNAEPLTVTAGTTSWSDVSQGARTGYLVTPAGSQALSVSDSSGSLLDTEAIVLEGEFHTLLVFDNADDGSVNAAIGQDQFRQITARTLFQFINISGETIDFYALREDESQDDTAPTFNDFGDAVSGVFEVLTGAARFVVTTSDNTSTLASEELTLLEGTSYTIVYDSMEALQILEN